MSPATFAFVLALAASPSEWRGTTADDLHREYYTIFGAHGNRNAASHLWSSFVLDRAGALEPEQVRAIFGGFCAVSGSIVRPTDYNRYRLTLPMANGRGVATGFMHYCCWPCVCDTHDFIKADTLTVTTARGPTQFVFAVLGDPCINEAQLDAPFIQPFGHRTTTLRREAPAVVCEHGRLRGATRSDCGHVIVSMLFDANVTQAASSAVAKRTPQPGRMTSDASGHFQDSFEYVRVCASRAANGYNSGMGEIFRRVAAITPIEAPSAASSAGAEAPAPDASLRSLAKAALRSPPQDADEMSRDTCASAHGPR